MIQEQATIAYLMLVIDTVAGTRTYEIYSEPIPSPADHITVDLIDSAESVNFTSAKQILLDRWKKLVI